MMILVSSRNPFSACGYAIRVLTVAYLLTTGTVAIAEESPAAQTFRDRTGELGLELANSQACWVDVDNDGWADLCAGGVVWRNNAGTGFVKLAEGLGEVVAADFDNDGFADLFSFSSLRVYRNNSGKAFEPIEMPKLPKCVSLGACWGDFNGDGFVDLYVGGYEDWDAGITYPDLLLMNEKGKSFHLAWSDARFRARGVTACDFDQDGDLDVYVSNYRLQPNLLWLNDGQGKFKDVAAEYNAVGTSPGFAGGHSIGAAWGDFDNDGKFDLFVGNFAHVDGRGDQPKSRFLRNLGAANNHRFEDLGPCGVFYQESYASPAAGDYDNDGRLDLFFTTVYETASFGRKNNPVLFRNAGVFAFVDATPAAGLASLPPTSQAAWADFDHDGDLDLVTAGKLFENVTAKKHWLEIHLAGDGGTINRSAIGAQVRISRPGQTLTRHVEAGTGQGNQNDLTLHFGLGDHGQPVNLEILWPKGKSQTIRNVEIDRLITVRSGEQAAKAIQFVDDNFEEFSQGTFDDGGHNLYAARDGTLRTINRFDLNGDGHLDIIFNCTHNTYQMLPATCGTFGPGRLATSLDIAVEGSQQAAYGDLNRDGFTDLVFCPNLIGVHHDRRFVTIAWGGSGGWSAQQINSPLPMNGATAVAIVDLNGDEWPDIAVLGGARWMPDQPEGRIIRIYWGSASGFSAVEKHDLGVPAAAAIAAGDFDGNGSRDLAVLRSDRRLTLIWNTAAAAGRWSPAQTEIPLPFADVTCITAGDATGDERADLVIGRASAEICVLAATANRKWDEPQVIPGFPATHVTIADLDRDAAPDLVLTQFDQARAAGGEQAGAGKEARDVVRILWGRTAGFSRDRVTNLEIPLAVTTAAADMDGDGIADLAVAIHQGETTFNGESYVWFGDGRRGFKKGATGIRTSGTLHVAAVAAEKDLPARAVFCNSIGGQLDEAVPLHVFWGGKGGFDPGRVWKLPFHSGYEASASDLNADGFTDLIVLNSGHAGEHAHGDPTLGANILWGGPDGLEHSTKCTVLHEHFLGTSSVADLNRDGWLDLVLEPFGPEHGGEKEKLFIYYGGADGFSAEGPGRRVALEMDGYAQEHLVADFNRDQWLDIAVTTRTLDCVRILWGGPQGFDTQREQRLKIAGPVGVDAADFNGDGWLDLLAGSYSDPVSGHRDMGLIIFWGGRDGYRHSNAQWLPGFSPLGRTVADFDGDGHLDLVSPQHSGELTREDLACHIYWGSASGFATRRRTTFFCDSVNDTMAGDFNGDGRIDLAVNAHTRHGDHRTESRIFYNDGRRFENPVIQKLPTNGPHLIWAEDVGHIYHRQYRQAFESRVLSWNDKAASGKLTSRASRPEGTRIAFAVRSAGDGESLARQAWSPVKDDTFSLQPGDRRMQYRVELHSDNGDRYPVVDRVEVVLQP